MDNNATEETPKGFVKMSPLEMNGATFSAHRTVLTPEMLEKMAETTTADDDKQ